MAESAADVVEYGFAPDGARTWVGVRLRGVDESHHQLEHHPIRHDVQGIVEALILMIIGIRAGYVVGERLGVAVAIGVLLPCRREQLVGNAHLDIVGLSGEYGDGLVLRLPAEARDRAVILVTVGMSGDT